MFRSVVFFLACFFICDLLSAEDRIASGYSCKRYPSFVTNLGFTHSDGAFSTQVRRKKGLHLISKEKVYQDPSWTIGGFLGGFVFNDKGDLFLHPAPHVNLIDNPPEKSNNIYRIDSATGKMKLWKTLPSPDPKITQSTFGVMGIAYSCFSGTIYLSSVFGSERNSERGILYHLDGESGEVRDTISGFDGFGLSTVKISGKNYLLVGSARSPNLFRVPLKADGDFGGELEPMASLQGLGVRGDDRVKKIVVNEKTQSLDITGYAFHFNLMAPSERQQSIYRFNFDPSENRLKFSGYS